MAGRLFEHFSTKIHALNFAALACPLPGLLFYINPMISSLIWDYFLWKDCSVLSEMGCIWKALQLLCVRRGWGGGATWTLWTKEFPCRAASSWPPSRRWIATWSKKQRRSLGKDVFRFLILFWHFEQQRLLKEVFVHFSFWFIAAEFHVVPPIKGP